MEMSGPTTDVALWLFYLCSLSGLLHSIPIQEEQVYQRRARRPLQLISSSPLSDELAVEAAWLQGKVTIFPKAFQLPLATVCVFLFVFVFAQHFIPSHASKNKHTLTHTHKQHQGGKTTLGPGDSQSSRKHLQGFEVRMRTLGNYGFPSPANKADKKKDIVALSDFIQSYSRACTHI